MTRENPLETFFDMEQGTVLPVDQRPFATENELTVIDENTELVIIDAEQTEKVPFKEKLDDEDLVIQDQLQTVFDKAIAVFHTQQELSEIVDPKFAARNAEVSGQFLTTALNAVQLRAKIKSDKDKNILNANVGAIINGNVTNNTQTIVANRNDLIKMLHAKKGNLDNLDL